MDNGVKRQYRSKARAEAAAQTRERIRQAAAELFAQQGYASTTLKQVADRADVGERTIYDSFGSKAQLLRHTINVLTVGDEQRILTRDRSLIRQARETDDPRRALALHLEHTAGVMERAGDLIMIASQVAGSEPELTEVVTRGISSSHGIHLEFTEQLATRGHLRDSLTPTTAADILYALAGPANHQALRRHRGWSLHDYRTWLTETAIQQLLATEPQPPSPPT